MVAKTEMTDNGRDYDSAETPNRFSELAQDIILLLELQTKLFVTDFRESISRFAIAGVSIVVAILLVLGAIPPLLGAFAQMLVSLLGMPLGWALLMSAVVAILVAGGLGVFGWWLLKLAGRVFLRSGREFSRNMKWFKESLKSPSTPHEKTGTAQRL